MNQYKYEYLVRVQSIIDPEYICYTISACNRSKYIPEPDSKYVKKVQNETKPKSGNKNAVYGEKIKFLLFSDPHIDYGYDLPL